MHRWLHAKDVVLEVLDKLPDVCRSDEHKHAARNEIRKTLASLARTCRSLYGPAMDRLWAELDDLSPLIKCMPSDLWLETRGVSRWNKTPTVFLTFRRKPVPADWEPFLKHAGRVKSLGILLGKTYYTITQPESRLDPGQAYRVDWDITSAVNSYLLSLDPIVPVFPYLRHLTCGYTNRTPLTLACVPRIIHPELLTLSLEAAHQKHAGVVGPTATLGSVFYALENVADLRLKGPITHTIASDVLDIILDPLACTVQTFTSSAMHTCRDLRTLAMFPLLEVLKLKDISAFHSCQGSFGVPSPFFPSLRELTLRGFDSRMCLYVLRNLSLPSRLLSIDLDAQSNSWSETECTMLIQFLTRCPNLHTIRLTGNFIFEGRDFARLFCLRNIQRLQVPTYDDLGLTALVLRRLDLAGLAHAWRDIRFLHLGWTAVATVDDYAPSLTDLHALRTLRDSCPRLESLVINLDGEKDYMDLLFQLHTSPIKNHPLQTLKIGPAASPRVTKPAALAMILALLFPQLLELTNRESDSRDQWRAVVQLFPSTRDPVLEGSSSQQPLKLQSVDGDENLQPVGIP